MKLLSITNVYQPKNQFLITIILVVIIDIHLFSAYYYDKLYQGSTGEYINTYRF